jgi:hypothetical protein
MVGIYGKRLYGKVDHVPGLFYVATAFVHLNFVPLFPTGSFLVIDDGTGEKGVSIGWSAKSMLMAWLRANCIVAAPIMLIVGLIAYWQLLVFGLAIIALLILSYSLIRVGRERAVALAVRGKLDPTFVHDHFDRLEGTSPTESGSSRDIHDPRLDEAMQRWNQ